MTASQSTKVVLGLATAGTLFAGYLSFSSLILKRCAFGEPCPHLWGLPSCLFGFAFFLTTALLAIASTLGLLERKLADQVTLVVVILGTAFAWRYAGPEIVQLFGGRHYAMGLPICAWGGIFFVAALGFSMAAYVLRRRETPAAVGTATDAA
jgi:hypothetical protein